MQRVQQPFRTVVDLLRWRSASQAAQLAYTFLPDGESQEATLTYEELETRARAIAAALQEGEARGERVLLLYPPGLEFIAAFFGCLYAGAVAVPAYPPRMNRSLLRLQTIAVDAGASVALTTRQSLRRVGPLLDEVPALKGLRWIATDDIDLETGSRWQQLPVDEDALAFLQYTSGSTAAPKGVMVSHGNLLRNEAMIQQAFKQTEDSVIVGWLPLYHDMGLIGNVLQPLYTGARCVLMSPVSFLQRPFRWLQAISRYRATTSGGPNFAYDLCARKISPEQRAALNLNSWAVAFNGSEPVRAETLERFALAFESCGFRREAFHTCYGLAEATLLVSSNLKTGLPTVKTIQAKELEQHRVVETFTKSESARTVVSCGETLMEQELITVHPETLRKCAHDEVGEIWVSGPNVAQGYWRRPEETERTFRARLSGEAGEKTFLRTGDLGFIADGELFVTGRLKDLIIIRGLNHYPQDIELSVEQSHPALRPGSGAAFSVEVQGEEKLVVVHEVERRSDADLSAVIERIRQRVAEEHEAQVYAVELIKAGSIPKTSSGKIRRHTCRAGFLEGSLNTLARWQEPFGPEGAISASAGTFLPRSIEEIEGWLISHLSTRLTMDAGEIDVDQPIARYGIDSLMAIELMHSIEVELGVALPLADFFESPSLAQLAAQVQAQLATDPSASETQHPFSDEESIEHPLSRNQQSMWFLHQLAPESAAYNIAGAVRIRAALNVAALRHAFQSLVDRHASLRTTFAASGGVPVQRVHERTEFTIRQEDASKLDEASLNRRLSEESRRPFDLQHGPLLRAHLFTRSTQEEHVILLVAHHIVADFWSLAVLMHELEAFYAAHCDGSAVALGPVALQYTDYVRWQAELLAGPEGERLWGYWQMRLAGELPVLNLPTDRPRPVLQTYRGASHAFRLDAALTAQLKLLGQTHNATLYMTLLAAFEAMLQRYTGQEEMLVGSITAGRSWARLAGLVGYFVNPLVLRAQLSRAATFKEFLGQVRQTVLAAFKYQDYPFAMLVERLQPERDPSRAPLFQVMFVLQKAHLLNREGLTSFALGETGAQMKLGDLSLESIALEQRIAQFDLTLMMAETEGELRASLQYNTDLFDAATMARMAGHFEQLLQSILAHPDQRLTELDLLTEAERHQILVEWNQTHANYPVDVCVHELIESQVERAPLALALSSQDHHLSYLELNQRANQLAHHLLQLGIRPESLVGLLLERSIDAVVALLAILKAGAAYLPFDHHYPPHRLAFMLDDASPSLLITDSRFLSRLPHHAT
ncbi:MAG: condensation domain-containing protein, partial [Pyrinomonadaceae bacterium]